MKCRQCNKFLLNQGYIHLNGTHDYFCNNCMPSMQPERLSPEDHFPDDTKMVCDSPNTANK